MFSIAYRRFGSDTVVTVILARRLAMLCLANLLSEAEANCRSLIWSVDPHSQSPNGTASLDITPVMDNDLPGLHGLDGQGLCWTPIRNPLRPYLVDVQSLLLHVP
jgi:hypothetical protein